MTVRRTVNVLVTNGNSWRSDSDW